MFCIRRKNAISLNTTSLTSPSNSSAQSDSLQNNTQIIKMIFKLKTVKVFRDSSGLQGGENPAENSARHSSRFSMFKNCPKLRSLFDPGISPTSLKIPNYIFLLLTLEFHQSIVQNRRQLALEKIAHLVRILSALRLYKSRTF